MESICRVVSRHSRGSACWLEMRRMESGEELRIRTWGTSLGGERHALAREEQRERRKRGVTHRERGFVEELYTRRGVSCLGGVCH